MDVSNVEIIGPNNDLGVFYGITKNNTPVWGRMQGKTITELHPIYARNHHSSIKDAVMNKK